MADVLPFKGVLYNQKKISEIADVVTPPYDVISEEDKDMFYDRHPNNIIRLILGNIYTDDTDRNNRYTRAADFFDEWQKEKILVQDPDPAFYLTSVGFPQLYSPTTRYGIIGRIKLEPFEKGVVLPHEKTFSKIKTDRLALMKTCRANFGPIFSLYSDSENVLGYIVDQTVDADPEHEFTDDAGHVHRMWRITDPAIQRKITDSMKDKKIYIADGHHRYETALAYRDWMADNTPGFTGDHPANYVMMYLSSMEDPGLIILPAHRLLKEIDTATFDAFLTKSEPYFDIESLPFSKKDKEDVASQFVSKLHSDNSKHVFGVFAGNQNTFYVMASKPGVMKQLFGDDIPGALRELDVTVLTQLIFMELLGFDQARLDNEKLIGYSSVADKAIDAVSKGNYDVAFILNSTKIDQVKKIAENGLIMPRKSTYFYPKVITGQVIHLIK